jgi:hypothetical protein
MNTIIVPVQVLTVAAAALVALLLVLRAFRLPRKYYANERERHTLRRRLIEKEYERAHQAVKHGEGDRHKGERR